jgi:hypothetical protein
VTQVHAGRYPRKISNFRGRGLLQLRDALLERDELPVQLTEHFAESRVRGHGRLARRPRDSAGRMVEWHASTIPLSRYAGRVMPTATEFDDPNAREDEDEELREGEAAPFDADEDEDDPEDDEY